MDTNIVFCVLAAACGDLALRLLSPSDIAFFAPRFVFVELFKQEKAPAEPAYLED